MVEFFSIRVKQAMQLQNLAVSQEVEFYLVQLLTNFAHAANLFQRDAEGKVEYRALALKMYDAVFDEARRYHHLKNLGDTALYHAGVFYDGLFNQVVNVDYYIAMGGQACQSLANLSTTTAEKTLADMYAELSERFPKLVEILKLTCESEASTTDHDLLRLLERYQKTGSAKAKQLLKEKGIPLDFAIQSKVSQ